MLKLIKKLKVSENWMKIRERFYPTKKNDPEHRALLFNAMTRYKKCTDKKNTSQIKREIQVCKKYWKCYPYHYFLYNLYKRDMEISDDELINYIPHFYWYRLFLPYYRSSKFMMITDNKIITDQIFRSLKIPQPETLFYIFHGHLYSPEMVQLIPDQIEHELNNTSIEKIFVKPAQGSGGYGINIFHKTDRGHYETRDNIIFNGDFLAILQKNQDYIVQGGVTQDPEISGIYPGSVNTFRIIAENMNGSVRVVCAMLRVGRGQSEVDNISSGGICTYIDVNSGKFGDFAISYTGERFEKHPDTQFAFRNFYLSRWDDIKRFTIEAAGRMPFFTYLGWDITLTANGPLVIEVNANPAHDVMEMSYAGLREAFGIEDPDYYWKNPGKRM